MDYKAKTTEELKEERELLMKAITTRVPWSPMTTTRCFELECRVQRIEDELEARGAITFAERYR